MRSATWPRMRCVGIWWHILLRSSIGLVGPSTSKYIPYLGKMGHIPLETGGFAIVFQGGKRGSWLTVSCARVHDRMNRFVCGFQWIAWSCFPTRRFGISYVWPLFNTKKKKRQTIKTCKTRGSHPLPFFVHPITDLYTSSRFGHVSLRWEELWTSRARRLLRWWVPSTEVMGSTMINFENLIMGWICCNMSLDGKKKKMNEWNSLINPFFFFRFTWHLLPKSVLDLLDSIFENQRERLPPMRMTETCVQRMHTSHKKLYFILFYFQKWGLVATSRRPKKKKATDNW